MEPGRRLADPAETERRFLELVDEAGLDRPDDIEWDLDAGELLFLWRAEKLAVVVDLRDAAGGLALDLPPV